MPQLLRVIPDDVRAAGTAADACAERFRARVGFAHTQTEDAQTGVPVAAGVALQSALASWSAELVSLRDRVVDFGGALQGFAAMVTETDDVAGAAYAMAAQTPEAAL